MFSSLVANIHEKLQRTMIDGINFDRIMYDFVSILITKKSRHIQLCRDFDRNIKFTCRTLSCLR